MNDLVFYANETVRDYLAKAEQRYGRSFRVSQIRFDLSGRVAGYACYSDMSIRLNTELFRQNTDYFINHTIPHEVAHLVSVQLYGIAGRGHKDCWKSVMRAFGVTASRCHQLDTSAVRRTRTARRNFAYRCGCKTHNLTSIRHRRILQGRKYRCKLCSQHLTKV